MTGTANSSGNWKDLLLIDHVINEYKKDSFLFREGDCADGVFYILSGKVQVGKITPDGREITFQICHSGDFISEVRLFCALSTYKLQAKVIEDSVCAKISKEDLEERLMLTPGLAVEFLKMMSTQQQKNQTKFRDLLLHGKKGALYSTLIRLTNTYGIDEKNGILIDLPLTNQELANFCGMSREVVNRLLSGLKSEGVLSIKNGKILISNLQFLKDEIHCEDCPVEVCRIN